MSTEQAPPDLNLPSKTQDPPAASDQSSHTAASGDPGRGIELDQDDEEKGRQPPPSNEVGIFHPSLAPLRREFLLLWGRTGPLPLPLGMTFSPAEPSDSKCSPHPLSVHPVGLVALLGCFVPCRRKHVLADLPCRRFRRDATSVCRQPSSRWANGHSGDRGDAALPAPTFGIHIKTAFRLR